jgi:hypothetical protein
MKKLFVDCDGVIMNSLKQFVQSIITTVNGLIILNQQIAKCNKGI